MELKKKNEVKLTPVAEGFKLESIYTIEVLKNKLITLRTSNLIASGDDVFFGMQSEYNGGEEKYMKQYNLCKEIIDKISELEKLRNEL